MRGERNGATDRVETTFRRGRDSFDVEVVTSEGTIGLRFYRDWSPLGVDRAHYLFGNNFYEGARFYRVVEGFVAQFGGSGDAKIDVLASAYSEWSKKVEPMVFTKSFGKGRVCHNVLGHGLEPRKNPLPLFVTRLYRSVFSYAIFTTL